MHPELITERFTLRPLREADTSALSVACQDPEILRWCMGVPLNYTEATARNYINSTRTAGERGDEFVWGIDASGTFAGVVTLHEIEGSFAELGFWAHPDSRGQGLLSEALRVMIGFAFDPQGLGFDTLGWTAIYGNKASRKVAEKLGFTNIEFVENGTAGRPDAAGVPTRLDAWRATMTREQWLDKNFRV